VARAYGYTGYFQLYNMPFDRLSLFGYAERRDLYQPGGINGGQATIIDAWRKAGLRFSLSDWRKSEEENLARLKADIQQGDISAAYLYLAAMDATLHNKGTKSPELSEKIAWYETHLRTVMNKAREHYGDVSMTIFSDHGMTDITAVSDLMPRIEALGLNFGSQYAAVYDSTMARFWFMQPEARSKVVDVLEREPNGRIVTDSELKAFGCFFPDRKYGDLFFLMDPGVVICPSFMGETRLAGMHGFDPSHEDSAAIFASTNTPAVMPLRLDDLYRVMYEATIPGAAARTV
jgi:predicted AlkP superfamily pyrophosphatase or phosphodiesterase